MKDEHQKPGGLLQEIQVTTWKWEHINMDFVVGLPRTKRQYDFIWVVVDRLTKSVHLFPSSLLIRQKIKQGSSKMRLCVTMVFHYPSYRIGVHNSYLGFGGHSKKGWVLR